MTDKQTYYTITILFLLFFSWSVFYVTKIADRVTIESYEIVKEQCVDSTGKVVPYDRYHPRTNYYVVYSMEKTIGWFPLKKIYSGYQKELIYDSEFFILQKTKPRDVKIRIESYISIFNQYKRANDKDSVNWKGRYDLVNWYEIDFPIIKE